MLHTMFQCHRHFGSGEDFLRFLPYMGMAAILVSHMTIWTSFRSLVPRRFHIKFGFNRPSGFRGDVYIHTHIYTDDRGLPTGSGELKSPNFQRARTLQKLNGIHLRIESRFWLFNEGMNGITDTHIVWWAYKNVRIGYSILTFIKRPKSTFYSYN